MADRIQSNRQASARIKSADAAAESKLITGLRSFLRSCKTPKGLRNLGRNPTPEDLLPFFEKYATVVFDAEAAEYVQEVKRAAEIAPEEGIRLLQNIIDDVVQRIVATPHGLWRHMVEDICSNYLRMGNAELGIQITRYGTYNVRDLMVPRTRQLRAALRFRLRHWESKLWELTASQAATVKQSQPEMFRKRVRMSRSVTSMKAAQRMEEFIASQNIGLTDFATTAQTTDRTLRRFRQTGRIDRPIFDSIAKAMGLTREQLLNS